MAKRHAAKKTKLMKGRKSSSSSGKNVAKVLAAVGAVGIMTALYRKRNEVGKAVRKFISKVKKSA